MFITLRDARSDIDVDLRNGIWEYEYYDDDDEGGVEFIVYDDVGVHEGVWHVLVATLYRM